ncbi:MAG: response regulator [Verrucomicrobiota bacterium]
MSAKILIIEDESDLVQALVMRLKAEGFQTACAQDGISALERARAEKPDLILLDICLPGRNGFEVFQQLRQDPAMKQIPVVFLTARSTMEDRQKARLMGAAGYVIKPFRWTNLMKLVHAVLSALEPDNGR